MGWGRGKGRRRDTPPLKHFLLKLVKEIKLADGSLKDRAIIELTHGSDVVGGISLVLDRCDDSDSFVLPVEIELSCHADFIRIKEEERLAWMKSDVYHGCFDS